MFIKFIERNYSVLPLYPENKNPMLKEWTKYCFNIANESEAEQWDSWFARKKCGIGLALGNASQCIAIDIDTDNEKLKQIVPTSPVIKRGAKGETRFFKYNKNIKLSHYNSLDILSDGSQTVLPPSIHPETKKPYLWLTPDTLENFDQCDLPELSLEWLPQFIKLADKLFPEKKKGEQEGGRNNWLKSIVVAQRYAGDSESDIVENIYNIDYHKNEPRLFTDKTENFEASNEDQAKFNAWRFVNSVSSPLIRDNKIPLPIVNQVDVSILLNEVKKFDYQPWPLPPHGLLKHIFEFILKKSTREQIGLSIGGALAIGSTLIANIYRYDDIYSNLYILNVAPTGAGKSYPEKCARELFEMDDSLRFLIGCTGYKSSSALESFTETNRERLDLIDECSSLLNSFRYGNNFQMELIDTLNRLYSSTGQNTHNGVYAGREASKWVYPCVSILMSTNEAGVEGSIDKNTMSKGLLPRCLIFNEDYAKQFKPDDLKRRKLEAEKIKEYIANEMIKIRERYENESNRNRNKLVLAQPVVRQIEVDHDAENLINDLQEKFDAQNCTNELDRANFTRAFVQIIKIAMISGALNNGHIGSQDVRFAEALYNATNFNLTPLAPNMLAENEVHANVLKVLNVIKKFGKLTKKEITKKTQFLKSYERDDILKTLVDSGEISRVDLKSSTKSTQVYLLIE